MEWATTFTEYAGGRRAPVGGLADAELTKRLRTYKRQVAKRYRVIDPDQIERQLTQGPYWISPKHDGELWFLVKRDDEVALCSFNGRVHLGTPLAKEAAQLLSDAGDSIIAGELTSRPKADDRSRVYHVASALGAASLEPALGFEAFDLVEEGDQDLMLLDYGSRLERLRALLAGGERVRTVETEAGVGADVLRRYREWVVTDRYEGLVVRSERGLTYKIKSTLTLDLVVLAYGERITGELRQMREMSLGLLRDDGTWQLVGPVGTGFSEEDRAAWYERLSPMQVPSTFRLANREGTLSKFVRPEIVLEVRCSDLLASDSWDAPIRRMSLAFDPEEGYRPVAEQPTAVMIHPIFLRERADKPVDPGSVGMAQLTSRVSIEAPREDPPPAQPEADPEVLRRRVFTKETKGRLAVRKYVLLATNRPADRSWPPFVAYFTDFSAGRKEPLQTALRTGSTLEEAEAQVRAWLADNIKRGWGEAAGQGDVKAVEPADEVRAMLEVERAKRDA